MEVDFDRLIGKPVTSKRRHTSAWKARRAALLTTMPRALTSSMMCMCTMSPRHGFGWRADLSRHNTRAA